MIKQQCKSSVTVPHYFIIAQTETGKANHVNLHVDVQKVPVGQKDSNTESWFKFWRDHINLH